MKKIFLKDNDFTVCTESSYLFHTVRYFFLINNYTLTEKAEEADIILINTCWVWDELESKVISYINTQNRSDVEFGIFWCLANRSKEINEKVTYSIPTKKEYLLDDMFNAKNSIKDISSKDINQWTIKLHTVFKTNTKKYFLEINRWCIHKCSYCAIKQSIWYVKSKDKIEVLSEFSYAVENGFNEIILVSDDVGSYGYDIGTNFSVLFNEICQIPWDYKININYTEPSEFMKWFPLIKENFYRVSEIIYPIQSFSDRILEMMRRTYSVADFIETLWEMRKFAPGIKITNHIIYAYPTETRDEYMSNLSWARYFDANLFNLYSYVKGTKVYDNVDIISSEEKKFRLETLFKLNKKNSTIYDIANKYD